MTSPPIRVETVSVRHAGRRPLAIAALVIGLVAVAIVKPWSGPEPARPAPVASLPAAVVVPPASSSAPGGTEAVVTAGAFRPVEPAPLAPGQIACGSADWRIVTLGGFTRWTVRTWIAISPVRASGPGDATIPYLSLGHSDIAGLGACADAGGVAAPGRASRIVAAWQAIAVGASPPTFRRVALADLDPQPSGGPVGSRPGMPHQVAELVRPVVAAPGGRWPAGRFILHLASPDASPDRWIGIDIGDTGA
jgi:hypothetical protein